MVVLKVLSEVIGAEELVINLTLSEIIHNLQISELILPVLFRSKERPIYSTANFRKILAAVCPQDTVVKTIYNTYVKYRMVWVTGFPTQHTYEDNFGNLKLFKPLSGQHTLHHLSPISNCKRVQQKAPRTATNRTNHSTPLQPHPTLNLKPTTSNTATYQPVNTYHLSKAQANSPSIHPTQSNPITQ